MNDFSKDHPNNELIRQLDRLAGMQPAPDATRQALERTRRALASSVIIPLSSRRKLVLKRFAAVAAVLLISGSLFAWLLPSPAPASFAGVQAAVKATHSMTCRQTVHSEGTSDQVVRLSILDTGLMRSEDSDGNYGVADSGKSRSLAVVPKKREAFLLQGANVPQVNFYEKIRNLPADTTARPLPGKKLDGKEVVGFTVKLFDHDVIVWADAGTRLPVRIEREEKAGDGKTSQLILDEIVFDKKLDEKLFSFDVPEGYKLRVEGNAAALPAAPADPQIKEPIVTPGVGIGAAKFGMTRAEVEKALGQPDATEPQGKNGHVQMKYGSRGFFLDVHPTRGLVIIQCFSQKVFATRIRDFGGKTDKGIALGSSSADIVKAYGAADRKELRENMTDLSYNKLGIDFTLAYDKLVQMFVTPRAKPK